LKRSRYFLDWLFLLLFGFILLNFRSVDYGLMQLTGQLSIVWNARPIEQVLQDPAVSDSVRSRIRFIREVERFGVDSLGLKPTKNYRSFYDQHGKPLLWVVTAAEPYSLKPYTWRFPVLGEVSYKGFFVKEKATRLADDLDNKGFDVYDYEVGAWSTLGWFSDPILSGMLWRSDGRLAELILHELTHATVYLESNVDLNENLASFVGEQGALLFLARKFGDTSAVYNSYLNRLKDDALLVRHMVRGATALRTLYRTKAFTDKDESRPALKQAMMDSVVAALDTLPFSSRRIKNSFEGRKWNNAHFLSYIRYDARKDSLLDVMQRVYGGNLKRMVSSLGGR
jgi:predicted aminopeptidase